MNRDKIACNCHHVTYGQIVDAVRNGADTLEKVQEATHAGTGCGHCQDFIAVLIRDIKTFPDDFQ